MKPQIDSESLVGNAAIKAYLNQALSSGQIGQSYLFSGPEGVGKCCFAKAFAKVLVGERESKRVEEGKHPDVRVFRPTGKLGLHSIESMRDFCEATAMSPFEAPYKVFILDEADRMLPTAANALLKTFEEPADKTLIILITSEPELILPTIRSRCRRLLFKSVDTEQITSYLCSHHSLERGQAQTLAQAAKGSLGQAIRLAEEGESSYKRDLIEILQRERFSSWEELQQSAAAIAKQFDTKKEAWEEEVKSLLPKDVPAVQRQALEKELEGQVNIRYLREVDALLEAFIGWFRDRQLLQLGCPESHLMNPECVEWMKERKKETLPSLERVQEMAAEARLAITRLTPLALCLETLFLKLGFL